ncbi:hypothetical protein BG61_22490 [Caballeronia glathei]|uniref:Uncharacterized protein n=1 Tax=Caballeronia glathei TaxID=60547 RepID=A0A069PLI9_9BURK|nr:hypothetical protein BG61_22490 [Caballeronia glathei]
MFFAPGVNYELHRVTGLYSPALRFPVPGELFLWRLRGEWHMATATNGRNWLTLDERRRVKGFNNPVTGRQFSVGRTVLRMILSKMLNCDPIAVRLDTTADDHVMVKVPNENRIIMADVSYVGMWVVIAVSAGRVGIGLVNPRGALSSQASGVLDAAQIQARERSHHRAWDALGRLPLAPETRWHSLVLPMPGAVRGAVTVDEPIRNVTAFGWTS